MMSTFSILDRNPETADRVQEILGLPDEAWSEVQISFGTEEFATAKVTLLLRSEQLTALAELAAHEAQNSCVAED